MIDKTYWLIERGSPAEWWGGSPSPGWVCDVFKVHPLLRFETAAKAAGEMDRIKYFPLAFGSNMRVTEHIDYPEPLPIPTRSLQADGPDQMTDQQTPEAKQCSICLDAPPYLKCCGKSSCALIVTRFADLELRLREAEAELKAAHERWSEESMHKILAMSEQQINALCRLEGHDPKDESTIVSQIGEIAIMRVDAKQQAARIAELEKVLCELPFPVAKCNGPSWESFPEDQREGITKQTAYELGHAAGVLNAVQVLQQHIDAAFERTADEVPLLK